MVLKGLSAAFFAAFSTASSPLGCCGLQVGFCGTSELVSSLWLASGGRRAEPTRPAEHGPKHESSRQDLGSYSSQRFRCMRRPPPSYVRLQVPSASEYRAARDRPASSRGSSSRNDASGPEERDFGAGFQCHLAVVRAILGELSPGRCDGAPRAGGVLKRPRLYDDVRDLCPRPWHESRNTGGPVWRHTPIFGSPAVGYFWSQLASHIAKLGVLLPGAATVNRTQPSATKQIAKRTSSAAADSKAAASNFAPLVLRRSIAMRVFALAICGYVAALQPARNAPRQSLAVRQAPRGVHQRVHERADDRRDDIRRRAATPTARPARRSTRRPRSRTPTIHWIRCSTPSARTRACARSSSRCSTPAARSPRRCGRRWSRSA